VPGDGRRGARRAGVGIADQLLYNSSNFVLTVLVARSASADEFGAFALIFTTWIICNSTCRGLTSETLVVRYSASSMAEWRRGASDGAGASAALGMVIGVIIIAASFVIGGSMATAALVIGIMLPGMFVQDFLRFAALSAARPFVALLSDLAVTIAQFGAVAALIVLDLDSVPTLVAAWGGAGWVGAIVGAALLRVRPNPTRAPAWFRREHDLAIKYALDDLASNGGQQAPAYVVAAVSGLSGAGSLRGAQSVFGPPSIFNLGVNAAVTPELVRVLKQSSRLLARYVALVGLGSCLIGLAWGIGAQLVPNSVGRSLYGETWALSQPLLIYFTFNQAANGVRVGGTAGLRALGAANRTLVARLISISLAVTFATTGAILDGPKGVAIGIMSASILSAAAYWWQFRLALDDHRRAVIVQRHQDAWERLVESAPAKVDSPITDLGWGLEEEMVDHIQQRFPGTTAARRRRSTHSG
jgi:O-antigen/teichoic acid export membrane protein